MHYARKERFVMNSATIALTSEQKAIIAEKMGLVSDELVLTSLFFQARKTLLRSKTSGKTCF